MKKYFIFVFLCMFQFAFADTVNLDLQSAINLAYENNSELKRQKISLSAAERNFKKSYNSLIPSITVAAGDSYVFPDEEPANTVNLEGNISLNIKPSIKAVSDKNQITYEIEKSNYEILANSVKQSVCDSFYEILEIKQQISLKKENQKNLKELYEDNKIKYEKGFLSEIEYLNSKILYEKSKSEFLGIELELQSVTNNFKLMLGIPVSEVINLDSSLQECLNAYKSGFNEQFQAELKRQVSENELPEIKALVYQKQAFQKELNIKKMDIWGPDFNFSYQINPASGISGTSGKIRNTFNAGVSIPLENFIPASQGWEEINIARDQISDIDIQITAKKQEAENSINNLILLVNQKMETLKTCETLVHITDTNLDICKTSYKKGVLDFQSLKNANMEYLEAQLEYSNLVLDILKTFSSLEQMSGKTMGEK